MFREWVDTGYRPTKFCQLQYNTVSHRLFIAKYGNIMHDECIHIRAHTILHYA